MCMFVSMPVATVADQWSQPEAAHPYCTCTDECSMMLICDSTLHHERAMTVSTHVLVDAGVEVTHFYAGCMVIST